MKSTRSPLLVSISVLFLSALSAHGQVQIFNVQPAPPESFFGESVAAIGYIDGDGAPDVAVGSRLADDPFHDTGAVWLLSGRDVAVLHHLLGDVPGLQLGLQVAAAGDVNRERRDIPGVRREARALAEHLGLEQAEVSVKT